MSAIYISESGGDSRVSATYAASTISGNTFVNNWDDVALWENADRFCNSPANTSSKVYKPRNGGASLAVCNNPAVKTLTVTLTSGSPNFTVVSGAFEGTDEGRPASGTGIPGGTKIKEPTTANGFTSGFLSASSGVLTANATTSGNVTMTLAAGTINGAPAFSDCRWHTQNITVSGNTFDHNHTQILGSRNTANANPLVTGGRMALFSQWGSFPAWSPYTGTTIQDLIVTQNDVWSANTYRGSYKFLAKDTSNQFAFASWKASPYNQDAGSTLSTTEPSGGGGGDIYLPDPPTNVVATAGNAQARVMFTPPKDDGGATLIGYTVTASPGGATATAANGPITVSGLTNNQAYTFTVAARTQIGPGTISAASSPVTPTTGSSLPTNTVPWQPLKVSAVQKTTTSAYVAFFPPATNGGASITGYTAIATDPSNNTVTATGSSSPITITGLTAGTAYSFTVTATNSVGTGPAGQPATRAVAAPAPSGGVAGDVIDIFVEEGVPGRDTVTGVFVALAGAEAQITGRNIGHITGPDQSTAAAGNATGSGVARPPAPKVGPRPSTAAGTGTAYQSGIATRGGIGVAAGTGAAYPTTIVAPNATPSVAAGTGQALQATVTTSNVHPSVAAGVGAANNAAVSTSLGYGASGYGTVGYGT